MIRKYFFSNIILILSFLQMYNNDNIRLLLIYFVLSFLSTLIFFAKNGLSNLFNNIFFIFSASFFIYAIFSPIYFIMNNSQPAINYFYVDYMTVFKSLLYYFYIYNIYVLLAIIFYREKNINIEQKLLIYSEKKTNQKMIFFFDGIMLIAVIFFIFSLFKRGLSVLILPKSEMLKGINMTILGYFIRYAQVYTFYILSKIISIQQVKECKYWYLFKKNKFRMINIVLFWSIYVMTGMRRDFLTVFLMVIIFYSLVKQITKKQRIIIYFIIFSLLILAYTRAHRGQNIEFEFNYFFYRSFGEFILPQYITYFYINNLTELLNGISYFLYPIFYLFPSFLLPFKPELLGIKFVNDSNVNIALAFNPVAEGLLNFGYEAIFFVPLIMFLVTHIVYRKADKNLIIYIIVAGSAVNYARGQFATWIFDTLFMIVLYYMMYVSEKLKEN